MSLVVLNVMMGSLVHRVYVQKNEPFPTSFLKYHINGSTLSAQFDHEQEWVLLISHIEQNPYRSIKTMTIEKKDAHMVGRLVFK